MKSFILAACLMLAAGPVYAASATYEGGIAEVRDITRQKVKQIGTKKQREKAWKMLSDGTLANIVELMIMHCFIEGNNTGSHMILSRMNYQTAQSLLARAQQSCIQFTIQAMQQ